MEKTAYDQRNGACEKETKTMQTQCFAKKLYFYRNLFRNRLTKSRRDDKIYRQSAVAVKIESGRVPEWPMGTDCKSAAFQLRWFESTRAHQEVQHPNRVLDLLFCRNFFRAERADSNSCGAVAEDSAKTARWAVFSSAARDIHPRPPRDPVSEPGTGFSVLWKLSQGRAGRRQM